ncbi:BMP family lipoprotein [Chelatococcus reniformis]|uniref:BMP family ABC transporter substrate-binding protein n=1 Tax=Chelatococcus reniformis TaxID=1494448 RepID=A0A916XPY4_9HYPH|nr:BMP family ABC transporter substrate-binding protein [Chelatococcus reniformis]GGC93675.1 BMP family ABC transporter substrate-binding protein [Chelatococcus reniformis]
MHHAKTSSLHRARRPGAPPRVALRLWAACALALAAALPGSALAQQPGPALVLDESDPIAAGFAASARAGAARFQSEGGAAVDIQIATAAQSEQVLRRAADQGRFPIIAVGRSQAGAVDKVAKTYPNLRFTIVDGIVGLANVRSIVFRREESAYLAGFLSARVSAAGRIGFIGGVDDAETRQVLCGFAQGARAAKPNVELFQNMIGAPGEAAANRSAGTDLTRGQLDRGADVVMEAARLNGVGVLRTVADAGRLAVASDIDQNALFPSTMLASAVKRVDTAVLATLIAGRDGTWQPGMVTLGLKEDGVSLALNPALQPPLAPDITQALDQRRAAIADGSLVVHDFVTDQKCQM